MSNHDILKQILKHWKEFRKFDFCLDVLSMYENRRPTEAVSADHVRWYRPEFPFSFDALQQSLVEAPRSHRVGFQFAGCNLSGQPTHSTEWVLGKRGMVSQLNYFQSFFFLTSKNNIAFVSGVEFSAVNDCIDNRNPGLSNYLYNFGNYAWLILF